MELVPGSGPITVVVNVDEPALCLFLWEGLEYGAEKVRAAVRPSDRSPSADALVQMKGRGLSESADIHLASSGRRPRPGRSQSSNLR